MLVFMRQHTPPSAAYSLRPLSNAEKEQTFRLRAGESTSVDYAVLPSYGIRFLGDTAMQPLHDRPPIYITESDIGLAKLRKLADPQSRLVRMPVRNLPAKLSRILRGIRVFPLSDRAPETNAYEYLLQNCDSITFAPYIVQTNEKGVIMQPGAINYQDSLVIAVNELITPANEPVSNVNQLLTAQRKAVFLQINGVFAMIEAAARAEMAKVVRDGLLPDKEEWREKAVATIMLSCLNSMRQSLEKTEAGLKDSIDAFIDNQQVALVSKLSGLNAQLPILENNDFGFKYLRAVTTPMPRSVPAVTADPSGAI